MSVLKINNIDITKYIIEKSYSVTTEILTTDAGRNAKGKMTFDIVARKKKIVAKILPLPESDVKVILNAIQSYVVTANFVDPQTGTIKMITGYVPPPNIVYSSVNPREKMCDEFEVSVIEM